MRRSVPAAMAAFALGISVLFVGVAPALAATSLAAPSPSVTPAHKPSPSSPAAQTPFVEANPSTAPQGNKITLRASCVDNLTKATVTGGPFGDVTVIPDHGFLTATAVIPTTATLGDYKLTLICADNKTTATGLLRVVARVEPSQGPGTGGGGTAPGRNAPMLIGGGLAALLAGLVLAAAALVRRRRFG
jgi:hypothetical protein